MENPPPSPQGMALLPPKDSGVAGGGGDGVLSPKEPNTMPPKEQRSTNLELLLPLAAAERPTQQPSPSTAVLSTASKHAAVDDTAPPAVTATTKPSPLIDPNDASSGTRDRKQPVISSRGGVAAVPSVTANSNPHNKDLSNSNNSSDTPIPAAPPMRFTSSIFSSASMPIPDLAASQSFGPLGCLATAAASTAPPLLAYTSTGHSMIGAPLLTTPVPVTAGDLTMAASALLDLTPAVAANSKRNRADPNDNEYHQKPAPKRGKSLRRSAASAASTTAIRTTAPTTMTTVRPARTSRVAHRCQSGAPAVGRSSPQYDCLQVQEHALPQTVLPVLPDGHRMRRAHLPVQGLSQHNQGIATPRQPNRCYSRNFAPPTRRL